MKRYHLICPKCNEESVWMSASDPDKPECRDCDEVLDIEELTKMVNGWQEYLKDRAVMLDQEKNTEKKQE